MGFGRHVSLGNRANKELNTEEIGTKQKYKKAFLKLKGKYSLSLVFSVRFKKMYPQKQGMNGKMFQKQTSLKRIS